MISLSSSFEMVMVAGQILVIPDLASYFAIFFIVSSFASQKSSPIQP